MAGVRFERNNNIVDEGAEQAGAEFAIADRGGHDNQIVVLRLTEGVLNAPHIEVVGKPTVAGDQRQQIDIRSPVGHGRRIAT